jgi:hypothetical protein
MKNYIIALKISKNLLGSFWTIKTVAARLLHAPPPLAALVVCSRAAVREKKQGGRVDMTWLPPFLAGGDL